MHERLVQKYKDRFNVPSEGEVRTEIQRLLRLQKMGRNLSEIGAGNRERKGMKINYSSKLEEIIRQDPDIIPQEVLRGSKLAFEIFQFWKTSLPTSKSGQKYQVSRRK